MNSISSMNNLLFRVVAFGLLFLAVSANAEEIDKVQELQRVIGAQQRQLEAQQRQLEAQMQMLMQLQSEVERLGKSADKEPATPREGGAPTQSPTASVEEGVPPESGRHDSMQMKNPPCLRRAPLSRANHVAQRRPGYPKLTGSIQRLRQA